MGSFGARRRSFERLSAAALVAAAIGLAASAQERFVSRELNFSIATPAGWSWSRLSQAAGVWLAAEYRQVGESDDALAILLAAEDGLGHGLRGHAALQRCIPLCRARRIDLAAEQVLQNEEHLTVETPAADRYKIGDAIFAMPTHICPTCAAHNEAFVIHNGNVIGTWEIAARGRRLTV